MKHTTRLFRLLTIPMILVLVLASLAPAALADLDRPGRLKIMPAVIQVWWIVETPDGLRGAGMGSGTIVSPDGLILTNHHVAFPDDPAVKYLGVALTTRSDQPPQPAYIATIVADDPYLDLAVLRISHDLDLRPIRSGTLNLPFVPLGESDGLDVGDELNIFGYPGIGGDTVTFTRGVVSGFTLDAAIRGRAWVKTDTTIAGGNSGGTAVDENGELVGVPTQMGAGTADAYVDCRPLADTDRDGDLDGNDSCVPGGGFLNALRPAALARPLIEAARQGLAYQGIGTAPGNAQGTAPAPATAGRARLFNLQFSSGVSASDQPTSLISALPSGGRSLYLFFDYENMVDGASWEMRVQRDGQELPDTGSPVQPWVGGAAGNWWVGWSDADFTDGQYTFQLFVDSALAAEAQLQVGGRAQAAPSFSNIVFSQGQTSQGGPAEPSRLFPEGVKQLFAFFDFENMTPRNQWTRTWYFNDEVAATTTEAWDEDASGSYGLQLNSDTGLDAGKWRLELAIDGKPAARADFTVAGQQGGAPLFQPFVFSDNVDQNTGKPITTGTRFPSGTKVLYVFSDHRGMHEGVPAISRVYLNGELVIESPFKWSTEMYGAETGTWWNAIHANGDQLPDGEYIQELIIEDQVVQRGSAVVGSGSPAPQPAAPAPAAPADGISIQGTIVDFDTGRPISGAFFIVLNPGITVGSFQWTDAEVYTMAEADRQGAYQLPAPLVRGECYSIIVGAEGYAPHTEDDICLGPDVPAQAELTLQLQRR